MIPDITQSSWTFQRDWTCQWIYYGCYHKDLLATPRINEISIQVEHGNDSNRVIIHAWTKSTELFKKILIEDCDETFRESFEPKYLIYSFVQNEEACTQLETLRILKKGLKILQSCDPSIGEVIRNVTLSLIFE